MEILRKILHYANPVNLFRKNEGRRHQSARDARHQQGLHDRLPVVRHLPLDSDADR